MKVITKLIQVTILVEAVLIIVFSSSTNLSAQSKSPESHNSQIKSAGTKVNLAPVLNPKAKPTALNSWINSPYAEGRPTPSADGSRIYFTRAFHPENTAGSKDPSDIWYSELEGASQTWSKPNMVTGPINNNGRNIILGMSVTGDTIILDNHYHAKGKMSHGLSFSVNNNGAWLQPTRIQIKNDYDQSETAESYVSLGMGVIISATKRKGGYGDRDLYVSFWNEGGIATEPLSMGGVINSGGDESSPFLDNDYRTLYFASKGHPGYGGYDIFVTRRLDNSWTNWTKPENLGPAINGILDDKSFVISRSGKLAYFSKQITVHNHDIFSIAVEELFLPKAPFR